jgi:hypothetical protein
MCHGTTNNNNVKISVFMKIGVPMKTSQNDVTKFDSLFKKQIFKS